MQSKMDNPEKLTTRHKTKANKTKQHYAETNTNSVIETCALLTKYHFYINIERKLQYQSIFGSGMLFNMVGSYIDSHRVILEEGTCLIYAICVCFRIVLFCFRSCALNNKSNLLNYILIMKDTTQATI
jgi:hypothetical protein